MASPVVSPSPDEASNSRRIAMRGEGQRGSDTQRPARLGIRRAGGSESSTNIRQAGRLSAPVSTPFSQRSNQRPHSARKPITGSGQATLGYLCAHGPMIPAEGALSPARVRGTALE